jgi:hypothetical protein
MKREKLSRNKEAVSNIVGTLLVLVILTMLYSIIQVYQVPAWNKSVEMEHASAVYSDMMLLKSDIENAAMHETPKSSDIHLGVRYPTRMFFINPGVGVSGSLKVEDDVAISVTYTNASGTYTKPYNSTRIAYEAHGTINSPKLVYEHGIIVRDFGIGNRTNDAQSLIVNDELYLPIANGSAYSSSSMGTETLAVYPSTGADTTTDVVYVNITLSTNYPAVWSELLEGVSTADTTAYVSGGKIRINSTAIKEITLPEMGKTQSGICVGVARLSTEKSVSDVVSGEKTVSVTVSANPASIPADGFSTSKITAVVTQEGTPIPFAAVNFGVGNPTYTVVPDSNRTTVNGIAEAILNESLVIGTATIYATVGTLFDTVVVAFTAELPAVTTKDATNIGKKGAKLNMDYDFKDYSQGNVRFRYKKASEGSWTYNTTWVSKSGSGNYTEQISGLAEGTAYNHEAQLNYDSSIINGGVKSFTTTS